MTIVAPYKARLLNCVINGYDDVSANGIVNFNVHELRIYEDICKAYFTGQLIIEAMYNVFDLFVSPGAPVTISFESPRSDGGPTRVYTQSFRIYSYDSTPRNENGYMNVTISLIGQEFYNDRSNVVQESYPNQLGTAVVQAIHSKYMQDSGHGGLQIPIQSLGLLGTNNVPYNVRNKKPIKAIHDVLDAIVFALYKSCAPVYYRNATGYIASPLEHLLRNAPNVEGFSHEFASPNVLSKTLLGYNIIKFLRPIAPPGEDNTGAGGSEIASFFKSAASFDMSTGNYVKVSPQTNLGNFPVAIRKMMQNMQSFVKAGLEGSHTITAILDQKRQNVTTDKEGPGGYNISQERFIASLTYSPKYWVTVPMQTGLNVTCGNRVTVVYPIGTGGNDIISKVLFVPRLIHELKITDPKTRRPDSVQGKTELYCVDWSG